jgi:hypothetical protein
VDFTGGWGIAPIGRVEEKVDGDGEIPSSADPWENREQAISTKQMNIETVRFKQ